MYRSVQVVDILTEGCRYCTQESSSSSSLLGDLFQEDEVQNFESALRRVQDENVSLEARIECAKSIRYCTSKCRTSSSDMGLRH